MSDSEEFIVNDSKSASRMDCMPEIIPYMMT